MANQTLDALRNRTRNAAPEVESDASLMGYQRRSIKSMVFAFNLFGVVFTLLLAIFAYRTMGELRDGVSLLRVSASSLRNHLEADMMHDAVRSDVLNALLAETPEKQEEVHKDLTDHLRIFREALERNRTLPLDATIKAALGAIEPELERYAKAAEQIVSVAAKDRRAAKLEYPKFEEAFEALEVRNSAATEVIEKAAARTEKEQTAAFESGSRFVGGLGAAVVLILLASGFFLARLVAIALSAIRDHLDTSARRITVAAKQVASSSASVATGCSDQAHSVDEAAMSSSRIKEMSQQNLAVCQKSVALVRNLAERANASETLFNELNQAMSSVENSSSRVAKIVKEIEEIAFQTTVLALNASVVAAKAGSEGAGFSTVADEVRNLAQRSSLAARETAELIDEASRLSKDGSDRASRVSSSILELVGEFGGVSEMISQIDTSLKAQAAGIVDISTSMERIRTVVSRNAASAEENAAVSEELTNEADSLGTVTTRLNLLVGAS